MSPSNSSTPNSQTRSTEVGVFRSERDAKQFFIEKVVAQATEEGIPLSDLERWMLTYSDSNPEFEVDPDKLDAFNQQISEQEYEAKIVGLIKRRYRQDISLDRTARDRYRGAYTVLDRGDHYLLALVDEALDGRFRHRATDARLGIGALTLIPAAVTVMMAAGMLWIALGRAKSSGEALAALLFALFLGSLAYYLIHLWRKYG